MAPDCSECQALKLLFDNGINLSKHSNDSKTALIIVCSLYQYESLALSILELPGIDYNHFDIINNTALIYACGNLLENVALKLLEFDDINYNHKNNLGYTALNLACKYDLEKVALKLLEKEYIEKT